MRLGNGELRAKRGLGELRSKGDEYKDPIRCLEDLACAGLSGVPSRPHGSGHVRIAEMVFKYGNYVVV